MVPHLVSKIVQSQRPFGFALFYLRGVAPLNVKTLSIYKGVVAFICLQLIALAIVGYYPQMVNYLPNRMSFLSATSPPPRNPKLQICLEEYVTNAIDKNKQEISDAINNAKAIDLSFLPIKIKNNLTSAFVSAEDAVLYLNDVKLTSEKVKINSYSYKPKLRKVRKIESEIRSVSYTHLTLPTIYSV